MKTILLVKVIDLETFKNIQNYVVKHYLKFFSWFTLVMFTMVLYVFLYRLFTDFHFSNL
ncbi:MULTISPECIES: DUF6747 family protein [unclassified Maribacter]|uniref:DUF6747 family protein n=1 Tax=unclassified Maribacter TaxID=2615042 RepID=UPI0032E4AB27